MSLTTLRRIAPYVFAIAVMGSPAFAQATRTWVSGVGDDANPCSRTAPCKTFAGAISKTAAGGEINALDPGGYGAVTITKSITIDGTGTMASILGSLVNGIIVNAAVNDVVVIRGLSINGATNGLNGIRFLAGRELHVEDSVIFRFAGLGIDFEPSGAAELYVKNTVIRNNVAGGILVKPGVAGSAKVSLDGVRLERSTYGLRAEVNSVVSARDSVAAGNTNNGILAFSTGLPVEVNLENFVASSNGTNGIKSEGAGSIVRITNVMVVNNSVGLAIAGGATIESFGNNRIRGNPGGSAAPNVVVTQQ